MSFDLGNFLQGQLGNVLGQFLTNQGESADSSAKAAGLAIPAVVAGLAKHVMDNPSNLSGVWDLVKGQAGNQLNGVVAQAAEGRDLGSIVDLGKSLLPNLLGGNANQVTDQIAQESGVSKAASGSLLAMALPLVLSSIRGKVQSDNLNQNQLLGLLGSQQGWLQSALGSGMLSSLGISSLSGIFGGLSNLMGSGFGAATAAAAAGGAAAKSSGVGKWLALIAAVALAALAFKSCAHKDDVPAPAPEVAASAASEVSSSAEEASAPVVEETSASEASAPVVDNARVIYENGVAKFFFATGKTNVAEGAADVVADVIAAGRDGKKLVISGYADSTGNAAANEELSKNRAQSVKAFFEEQGVAADNIELRKPESTTGAQGNDVEGRRVEVKVEG